MIRFDRGAVQAALLLVATLILGVVAGVALDRWVLRPGRDAVTAMPGMDQRPRFDPAGMRMRFSNQLARELGLEPAQRLAIDSLLRLQQSRARAVMIEREPELRRIAAETRTAIRGILTEEQWKRWQELRERRMPRRR